MIIFNKIDSLQAVLAKDRAEGKTIGFIPSMGALHAGHMTLAQQSLANCDRTVFEIFVNPKQFGPNEDFDAYPRQLAADTALLEEAGVDYCFIPSNEEMWPEGNETYVDMERLSLILMGQQRPGHFRGMMTLVVKLFNIVRPDKAFFGEKDFQQLAIIRRMVKDLNFPIEIKGVPTHREPDGLAYSSRNQLLTPEDRKAAIIIPQSWRAAERLYQSGERSVAKLVAAVRAVLEKEPRGVIEAVDLHDVQTLDALEGNVDKPAVLLLTVLFGRVRLIDQHVLGSGEKT